MNGIQEFEGDILLYETADGGELKIEDGLFISDKQFSTAVYLSLFGGNKDDSGKIKNNKEWWGNMLNGIYENEKLKSRFQYVITGFPMTVKSIKEAETAAFIDLEWFIKDKIADEINIYGWAAGEKKFNLNVEIKKDIRTLFKNTYFLFWGVYDGSSV
jgi:phage gp46-like protein